jgi:hypothetical protein
MNYAPSAEVIGRTSTKQTPQEAPYGEQTTIPASLRP